MRVAFGVKQAFMNNLAICFLDALALVKLLNLSELISSLI